MNHVISVREALHAVSFEQRKAAWPLFPIPTAPSLPAQQVPGLPFECTRSLTPFSGLRPPVCASLKGPCAGSLVPASWCGECLVNAVRSLRTHPGKSWTPPSEDPG